MKKKTALSKAEVKHIAQLSDLELTLSEIGKFQKQLSGILNYVEQLEKVKTRGIQPTSQVTGLENVFREDTLGKSLTQKDALSNSLSIHGDLFKIKGILGK